MASNEQLASLKKLRDLFEKGEVNQQSMNELSSLINNLSPKSADASSLTQNSNTSKPAFKQP